MLIIQYVKRFGYVDLKKEDLNYSIVEELHDRQVTPGDLNI